MKFELAKGNVWHNAAREFMIFGSFIAVKTTRAGCTTGLIGESVNQDRVALIATPTHKIRKEAVASGIKFSSRPGTIPTDIEPNHECIHFKNRCKDCSSLKKAKMVVLPEKCVEKVDNVEVKCEYYDICPITKLARTPESEVKMVTVTHTKIAAMQMAYDSYVTSNHGKDYVKPISVENYEKIKRVCDMFILDECHQLEKPALTTIKIVSQKSMDIFEDMVFGLHEEYAPPEEFPIIQDVIKHINLIIKNAFVQEKKNEMLDLAKSEEYWKKHLCVPILNPHRLIFKDENGEMYDNQGAGMVQFYSEMMDLIVHLANNFGDMYVDMIMPIYDYIKIVTARTLSVHATRENGIGINVNIVANDGFTNDMIAKFTRGFQNDKNTTIFTSATIGDFDYSPFFKNDFEYKMWGGDGDPMQTNSNVLVLCDSKKFDRINKRYSIWNNRDTIVKTIIRFLQVYGHGDVIIFAQNEKMSRMFESLLSEKEHEHIVHYYGSSESIGVEHHARVCICIGMAEKPSSICDCMTLDPVESKKMRMGVVHADTFQAVSRAKDSNGKVPSVWVMLGVNQEQAEAMVKWGSNRKVGILEDGEVIIRCDQFIPAPRIIKCNTYDKMLEEAQKHRKSLNKNKFTQNIKSITVDDINIQNKYIVNCMNPIFPINITIGNIESIQLTIYLPSKIIGRYDTYGVEEEGSLDIVHENLTEKIIEDHNAGTRTIGACMLKPDNTVESICLEIRGSILQDKKVAAQQNKNTICNFLDSRDAVHYTESFGGYSYRIWIPLKEPMKATDARMAGRGILKELGIKEDVEVFPKQCKVNKNTKGDYIPMPRNVNINVSVDNYASEATVLN